MKILMTADTIGGVWTYALELSRALQPHRAQVALATMGAPLNCDQRREIEVLPYVELHESTFKLEWMDDPWHDVARAGEWLQELESAFQPDVIHLNGYAHGALPWRAPSVVVAHSCVWSWWQAVKGEAPPSEWNHYHRTVMQGLQAADCVIAPTEAMLHCMHKHYGALSNAGVIYNGRDFARFTPGCKQPYIFSAGRVWDEAKNVTVLQEIAPHLAWPVYVAGDACQPQTNDTESNEPAPALGNNLHKLGRLAAADMATWLASASIYCLPARYEPFGLSALEAALCGCALVLGDIPSLREVWRDAAVFVDPQDAPALAATLNKLSEDDTLCAQLGERARERGLTFGSARMGDEYAALYRELCATSQGSEKSQARVLAA